MVVTEKTKYVKYLSYEKPGTAYEEFYDLEQDPEEGVNRIGDPAYQAQIAEARSRMEFVIDQYPPAQKTWTTKYADHRMYY